jgi:hypothetical protein
MNCPHCNQNLPKGYDPPWCPYCGKNLDKPVLPEQELPPIKFKWQWFLCSLLAPPLLTLLSATAMRFLISTDSTNENVTPFVALISGAIGGILCGIMLGLQSRSLPARIFLSILMSAIMIPVCIVLCFFGCSIGGYQFSID